MHKGHWARRAEWMSISQIDQRTASDAANAQFCCKRSITVAA